MHARRRLLSLILAGLAGPALADTTIIFDNSGSAGGDSGRMEIADGKIRADSPGAAEAYTLFHTGSDEFIVVNPEQKTYMVFDQAAVEKVAEAQRRAMQQMEAQLANLPPAQREQMKKMMSGMMGGAMPGDAPEPRRYERGGQAEVAGHSCEELSIYVGDRLASEQCVIDPDVLDIPAEDWQTLKDMQRFVVDLTSQFSFMANQVMDYGEPGQDEMPIRYTLHMPMVGKTTGELRSVDFGTIDPSRFAIPEGYKRQEMPEIGG